MLSDKKGMQRLAPLYRSKALLDNELFAANFIAQLRSLTAGSLPQKPARGTNASKPTLAAASRGGRTLVSRKQRERGAGEREVRQNREQRRELYRREKAAV